MANIFRLAKIISTTNISAITKQNKNTTNIREYFIIIKNKFVFKN